MFHRPVDRNRTMYLIFGWSIITILSYSNLIPTIAGFPFDHIGSFLNVLIITYSVSRYHLLDIKFVIRRGLAFTLALIPLAALFARRIIIYIQVLPEPASLRDRNPYHYFGRYW